MGMGVAIAAAAVGTAVSAGSAIMQGRQQAEIAEAQAASQRARAEFQADQQLEQADSIEQQAEEQERRVETAAIQAQQQANARRERLRRALASQTAAAASQGVSIGQGGSLQAIQRGSRRNARRDLVNVRFMGQNQQRKLALKAENTRTSAANARKSARSTRAYGQTQAQITSAKGEAAERAGFFQAGATIANSALQAQQSGMFQSPPGGGGSGIQLDGRVFPGAGVGGVT